MGIRLGELLVQRGLLTEEQVEQIIAEQAQRARPFGELAERMFGLAPEDVENAWAEQFSQITQTIDPTRERFEASALTLVSRRQAWQFRLMPVRRDDDDLMVVTTAENLPRAARFVAWKLSEPVYFVLCRPEQLEAALNEHYPFPGLSFGRPCGAVRSS